MARSRAIHQKFFSSEHCTKLSFFDRLLFIGLVTLANDYGKCRSHPAFIKSQLFPYDSRTSHEDIMKSLGRLQDEGMILQFEAENSHWLLIWNWGKYQNPAHPGKDLIPNPSKEIQEAFMSVSRNPRPVVVVEVGVEGVVASFEAFWKTYPKKKSKGDALKAWNALKPTPDLKERILKAVEVSKSCADWLKEGGKFIPYPATWLRAQGWEDEISTNHKREVIG